MKRIVYCFLILNLILSAKFAWSYYTITILQDREQRALNDIFPVLSEETTFTNLRKLFPFMTHYNQKIKGKYIKYNAFVENQYSGYAYQVRENILCPVCKDVRFMVKIHNNRISDITLINPFHLYGQELDAKMRDKFIAQFIGKTLDEQFTLNQDIDGISGATKTAEHFVRGIRGIKKIENQ